MIEGYISIGEFVFPSVFAISYDEQQKGLMHVSWPPPVMCFPYKKAQINKFWMHNTPSPLDIVFCMNNKVSQIHEGEPYSTKSIGFDKLSDLVIEFPLGTIKQCKIKVGDSVKILTPSFEQIKKITRP